jgi:hypothetical protein
MMKQKREKKVLYKENEQDFAAASGATIMRVDTKQTSASMNTKRRDPRMRHHDPTIC